MKKLILLTALLLTSFLYGCGSSEKTSQELSSKLNVYNWTFVLPETVIKDFEKEFGVKVTYDNYYSNEELLAKIQNPTHGYDVIFPSDYMIEIMIKQKLLSKVNYGNIPNADNIDERFKNSFYDPTNEYSLPFQWTTAGIGVNTDEMKDFDPSWDILFDPGNSGEISMLDDMRYGLAPALIKLGYSPNTKDENALDEAGELMKKQKTLVKAYSSDNYMDLLKSGETSIAYGYSVDFLQMHRELPNIEYVLPKEGSTMAVESMVIPKDSKRKATAEAFINYILRPEVHAKITEYSLAANPNKAALEFLSDEIKNNKNIFPDQSTLDKMVYLRDVGDATPLYDKTWNSIKNY